MSILKKIVLGLILLTITFLVVGLVLPSKQTVERSAVYQAKPAAVYAYLNGYRRFNEWSPWAELDPNTKYSFAGPPVGVGAKQSWASTDSNVGTGSQEIIEVRPYSLIKSRLQFGGWDTASIVSFSIVPEGNGTRLSWGMEADLGRNPVKRWFGVFLDKMVGKDYEKGLANLKPHLEALSRDDIEGLELSLVRTEAMPYLFVSDSASESEASAKLAAALGKVMAFMQANGIKQAAPPIALTRKFDDLTSYWEFDAGIPVDSTKVPAPAETGLQYAQTYAGYALRATHIGSYTAMQPSYARLLAYKAAAGLEDGGGAWEQYLSDPGTTPQDRLITRIYWPVR